MKKILKAIDDAYISALSWATSSKGAMYTLTLAIWTAVILNPPKTIYEWLIVIVSVYYQGVALPGLGYQDKLESSKTRQLIVDIHSSEEEELKDLKDMQEDSHRMLAEIKEVHAENKEILKALQDHMDNK